LPDPNSENGPQQDIRVKDQALAWIHLRLPTRHRTSADRSQKSDRVTSCDREYDAFRPEQ
jgi:hypothetical protein